MSVILEAVLDFNIQFCFRILNEADYIANLLQGLNNTT